MVKNRRNKPNTLTVSVEEVISGSIAASKDANEVIEAPEATHEVIEAFEATHEVIEAFEATHEVIEATNEATTEATTDATTEATTDATTDATNEATAEATNEDNYLPPIKMTLRQWQRLVKPEEELIVAASNTDGSDSWQPWPIGMTPAFSDYNGPLETVMIGSHNKTVLCSFSTQTDANRRMLRNRAAFARNLAASGINNEYTPDAGIRYYFTLPNYKFVVCPEGNGIDTHRLYEALIAGCIPIVERRPHIADKYKGCPILYTTDYSEINELYLREKYEQMIDKEYDFSNLYFSTYSDAEQAEIKANSDFWCRTLGFRRWF
jgi:hypothetical protein